MIKNVSHIIWDWNGTLFDDVDLCVDNINWLLEKYGLQKITKDKYREIFTFPVIEYYRKAGFDLDKLDFYTLGKEWMERYEKEKHKAGLAENAAEIVQYLFKTGIEQSILSAYSQHTLVEIVDKFNLTKYIKNIVGLDNIYAESKINLGKKLMNILDLNSDEVILIGDTVHDYEVSLELGCGCILVSSGHQSKNELEKCNVPIVNNLSELKSFL